ncbi:MAG: hypothetical protein ROZ09_07505 [Thiobacillus sp.]|jgi:hypothetical protein|uniref:hypothetical protein n=1 Tax=Thiobacillus sp. TaxID=924 RepID=UPI002895835A|nr:hypothetical protein [Thiobacillus sp.]MDT3706660.1 hypothetical protein [Thiobacillus sp.]
MRLLALTPAELAFLTTPSGGPDDLPARLTRKLAATLSARLRLPISLALHPTAAPVAAPEAPVWQADDALASLWLTRRLGGQRVSGATTFVPASLIHTLDAALAEGWLDARKQGMLPAALTWHLHADLAQATLAVQLPHSATDMTRWARGVIRHG